MDRITKVGNVSFKSGSENVWIVQQVKKFIIKSIKEMLKDIFTRTVHISSQSDKLIVIL